ncbi:hypothetical protein A4X06_0g1751, partial [Tilletia controversa]
AMTRNKFLDLMAVLAERAGLEKRTGHSMRIGGCTSLLKKGVPLEKVMLQGRWDSNSWKRPPDLPTKKWEARGAKTARRTTSDRRGYQRIASPSGPFCPFN